MKKIIYISIITFFLSDAVSFGQGIKLPLDSLEVLLCKQWVVNFEMREQIKNDTILSSSIIYEFKKDRSFFKVTKISNDTTRGTWSYDENKKLINLIENGESHKSIISLKEGELVMLWETMKDRPFNIKVIFKKKEVKDFPY